MFSFGTFTPAVIDVDVMNAVCMHDLEVAGPRDRIGTSHADVAKLDTQAERLQRYLLKKDTVPLLQKQNHVSSASTA